MQRRTHAKPKSGRTAKPTAGNRSHLPAKKKLPNDTNPNEKKLASSPASSKARFTRGGEPSARPNPKREQGLRSATSRVDAAAKDEEFEDIEEVDAGTDERADVILDDEDFEDAEDDEDEDFDEVEILAFDEDDESDDLDEDVSESDPAWRRARSGNIDGRQVRYFLFGDSVSEGGSD